MLKTILIAAVAALALLLIYAATRPDSFRVERSTRINAQPDKVFALINERWLRKSVHSDMCKLCINPSGQSYSKFEHGSPP